MQVGSTGDLRRLTASADIHVATLVVDRGYFVPALVAGFEQALGRIEILVCGQHRDFHDFKLGLYCPLLCGDLIKY